jgi:predicted small secreted protein
MAARDGRRKGTDAMRRARVLTCLLALAALAAAGCNASEGVGKDLEEAGEKIQEKAREHK